ncbi:MAG TPA: tetratricopeptide repeat protein [Planctomycetota bacterium]|nr:tetratricopeptide repeat protein [Planctomycetota bacterium]
MNENAGIDRLLESLEHSPEDVTTFRDLEEYYTVAKEWENLRHIYDLRAKAIESKNVKEAILLYAKQGECAEKKINNLSQALTSYKKAFQLSNRLEYCESAIRVAEATENWQEKIHLTEEAFRQTTNKNEKVKLLFSLAKCYQHHLHDLDKAIKYYQQILQFEDNENAFQQLETIFQSEKKWNDLVDLYQSQSQKTKNKADKVILYKKSAQICETHLQYIPQTIEYYEKVISLVPNDMTTLHRLESLYNQTQQWKELIGVLEKQLPYTETTEDKVKLLNRIALFWSEKLKDLDKAVENYEKALKLQEDKMILAILEETFKFQEKWEKLANIYQKQLPYTKPGEEKKSLLCTLAVLQAEKLQKIPEAIASYKLALIETPEDKNILRRIEELYAQEGDVDNLLNAYRDELKQPLDSQEKWQIYLKIIDLLKSDQRLPQTANVYEEMLSLYPTEKMIFQELSKIYQDLGYHEKLLQVWLKESNQSIGKEQTNLFSKIAQLLQTKLNREKEAVSYYQKVLLAEPDNLETLQILQEYYKKQNIYDQHIITLEKIAQITDQYKYYWEIADIQQNKLKDIDATIQTYKKILSRTPRNKQVYEQLKQLYQEKKSWDEYIQVCEKLLDFEISLQERLNIHYSLAELFETRAEESQLEHHLHEILQNKPEERKAIEKLITLYTKKKKWERLADVLEREAQNCAPATENPYIKIASIYEEHLEDTTKAIENYEKARLREPENIDVLFRLIDLYHIQQKPRQEAYIRELLADYSQNTSPEQAALQRCEAASLQLTELNNETKAAQLYETVLYYNPEHKQALEKLENIWFNKHSFEKLINLYEMICLRITNPKDLISLHTKAAEIAENDLEDFERAAKHYEQILKFQRDHVHAMQRLEAIYLLDQAWSSLIVLYEHKLQVTENKEEQINILYNQANIYDQQLHWEQPALRNYRKILTISPHNLKTLVAMETLCRENKLYIPLVECLEEKLKTIKNIPENQATRQEIYYELGTLCSLQADNPTKAIHFYQEVTKIDPDHLPSWQALHRQYLIVSDYKTLSEVITKEIELSTNNDEIIRLLNELAEICELQLNQPEVAIASLEQIIEIEPKNENAFQKLETLYTRAQDHDALLKIWERHANIAEPEEQKQLLFKMACFLTDQNQPEQAIAILCQIIEFDKTYQSARDLLAKLYRTQEQWQELVDLYEEELQDTMDIQRLQDLYIKLGHIWRRQGSDSDALEMYRQAAEYAPDNVSVLRWIAEIYAKKSEPAKLLKVMQQELGNSHLDQDRRIILLLQTGEVQEFSLDNPDAAGEQYKAVLDIQETNEVALRGLERIYQKNKEYNSLRKNLETQLSIAEKKDRILELKITLGVLIKEKFSEPTVALEYLEEVYKEETYKQRIIQHLKNIYQNIENWEAYARIVEDEINYCHNEHEKQPLHAELVQIYDKKLNNAEKAIEHGKTILETNPFDKTTILALEELYQKINNQEALADCYIKESQLPEIQLHQERLKYLYAQISNIYYNIQHENTIQYYTYLVELDPTYPDALPHLVELLTKAKKWQELIQIYERASQISKNRQEVQNLYLQIALLWEKKLNNFENALHHYQIAYQIDMSVLAPVKGMRHILEKMERWNQAVAMLDIEATLIAEKKRPAVYLRLGDIWKNKLQSPYQALQYYNKVKQYGFNKPTEEKILQLQEELEDFAGWVETQEKLIKNQPLDAPNLLPNLIKLGCIYWDKLHDANNAIKIFTIVLKQQKQNQTALHYLDEIFTETEQWPELVDVLIVLLETSQKDSEKYTYNKKLGDILYTKMHRGDRSSTYYEQALTHTPEDLDLIHTLAQNYAEWGQYKKLIQIHQTELPLVKDKTLRTIQLYHEIADIWEKRLFDPEHAIATYYDLLEIYPKHQKTMERIAAVYRRQHQLPELLEILEKIADYASMQDDIDLEIQTKLEIGRLYKQQNQPEFAIQAFQRVLELEEFHEEAFTALEELYQRESSYEDMVEILEEKIRIAAHPENHHNIYLTLGKIYEENINNKIKAIQAYENALQIQPENKNTLKTLQRLYTEQNIIDKLNTNLKTQLTLDISDEEKAELTYLLGEIAQTKLQNTVQTKTYFQQVLHLNAEHAMAHIQLAKIAENEKQYQTATEHWLQAVQNTQDTIKKAEYETKLGYLFQEKLQDPERSIEQYQNAVQNNPHAIEPLQALVQIRQQQQEWNEIEPILERLISLITPEHPEWAQLHVIWAKAAKQTNRISESIARYITALEAEPDNVNTQLALADIHFEQKEWQLAYKHFQEALQLPNVEDKNQIIFQMAQTQEQLEHFPMAIDLYKQVVKAEPGRIEALESLARVLEKNKEYSESLHYIQKILEYPEDNIDEHYRIRKIQANLFRKLQKDHEAIQEYQAVYEYNPADKDIPAALAQLYVQTKNWEQAEHWNQQHYQIIETTKEKIENRCLHGFIQYQGCKKTQQAIQSYTEALNLDPTHILAVQQLANIYIAQQDWQTLATTYQNFLHKLPQHKQKLGFPFHLALGNLYRDELNDNEKAEEQYKKALSLAPGHLEAQIALTDLKSAAPETREDAIKGHIRLLQQDQFRLASYEALLNLLQQDNQTGRAIRVCRIIQILNPEKAKDTPYYTQLAAKPITKFSTQLIPQYIIPTRIQKLHDLMAITGDRQEKTYPVYKPNNLSPHLGTEKVQRPIWYHTHTILTILDLKEKDIQMHITSDPIHEIQLLNTIPPTLILPQSIIDNFSEPEQRFLLTKALFYVVQGQTLAHRLSLEELTIYFQLLRSNFVKTNTELSPDAKILQKKIYSSLSWRATRQLKNYTQEDWTNITTANILNYIKCLEYASNRLGLFLSDSLETSVKTLCFLQRLKTNNRIQREQPITLKELKETDGVADLFHFSINELSNKLFLKYENK